jgi:hypothetical protein
MRAALLVPCLALSACGIAFGAPKPARVPDRFEDVDDSRAHEDQKSEGQLLKASQGEPKQAPPPIGVSVVVGGTAVDAGPLPKPPVPIVRP